MIVVFSLDSLIKLVVEYSKASSCVAHHSEEGNDLAIAGKDLLDDDGEEPTVRDSFSI